MLPIGQPRRHSVPTLEGGVMQARTHRDVAYFDHSVQELRAYFELLLSDGSAPVGTSTSRKRAPVRKPRRP